MVKLFLRQGIEAESCNADHLGKLAGGQHAVNILIAGCVHLRALALIFLGDAGHDRYDKHLVARNAHLVCVVGLGDCAEHLLRRLAGGDVRQQIRVGLFHKVDPSRAAGSDHREHAAILHAVEQLIALLHDGQVSSEVGVKNLVESKAAQGSYHLAGCNRAARHAKFLADGDTDRRSGLDDDKFIRVVDGVPNALGVVLLIQCADRTGRYALAAVNAWGLIQRFFKGSCNLKVGGAAGVADGVGGLYRLASLDAASAANAFDHIAHQRRVAHLFWNRLPNRVEDVAADIIFRRQGLQLALAVFLTVQAVLRVVGQNQLQNGLAGLAHLRRVGGDIPRLVDQVVAGSFQPSAVAVLYQADAAKCADTQVWMVAEGRNFDADFPGGFHNGGTGWHGHRDTVNFDCNHLVRINMHTGHHTFCYLNKPDKCP